MSAESFVMNAAPNVASSAFACAERRAGRQPRERRGARVQSDRSGRSGNHTSTSSATLVSAGRNTRSPGRSTPTICTGMLLT